MMKLMAPSTFTMNNKVVSMHSPAYKPHLNFKLKMKRLNKIKLMSHVKLPKLVFLRVPIKFQRGNLKTM